MEDILIANKKLNEWCGTEGINYYEGDTALGFLFKYAVPKLNPYGLLGIEFHNSVIDKVLTPDEVWGFECHIKLEKYILDRFDGQAETPALALFGAICGLAEGGI